MLIFKNPSECKRIFEAEVDGLKNCQRFVRVPDTYMLGETSEGAYLLMEWIEPGKGDQRDLAAALANLHQQTAPQFGFRKDNYLGTLVQKNSFEEDWWTFSLKIGLNPRFLWQKKRIDGMYSVKKSICDLRTCIEIG